MVSFSQSSSFIIFEHNIINDFQNGISFLHFSEDDCSKDPTAGEACGNYTIRGNLFHGQVEGDPTRDARAINFSTGNHSNGGADAAPVEITFNSFVDANASDLPNNVSYWEEDDSPELKCNLMFNAGVTDGTGWSSSGTGEQGSQFYGGFTEAPSDDNGGGVSVNGITDAELLPYTYFRSLITGPEQIVVVNARPAASSSFANACARVNISGEHGAE